MLLFRSSRLWYCLQFRTNNTEPTLYVYKQNVPIRKCACTIYTHYGRLCRYVLEFM